MSTTLEIELVSHEQERTQSSSQQPFAPGTDEAVVQVKQKWNEPQINKWRLLATFISFALVGASDGVYGVSHLSVTTLLTHDEV